MTKANNMKKAGWIAALIYIFPALMDIVVSQVLFINQVRIAQITDDPRLVTGLMVAWGASYMAFCPVVGRFLTARNASTMLVLSCLGTIIISALFPLMPSLLGMYFLTGVFGILVAFFFPPFQLFMKAVDTGKKRSLTYSTGMYTFSWSMGFAIGPLVSGFLMDQGENGWMYCYILSAVISLLTAVGIYYLRHYAHVGAESMDAQHALAVASAPADLPLVENALSDDAAPAGDRNIDYGPMPDLAWLAWLAAGGALVAIAVIRSLFPAEAENVHHLSSTSLGLIFFTISFVQAITGLILCRSRLWMYRGLPVVFFGLFGVAGLICFMVGTTFLAFILGSVLFGVFAGTFYFYFVFHAIAHPLKAGRYASINETVVGLSTILGPILAGVIARELTYSSAYGIAAMILTMVVIYQVIIHRRNPVRIGR